MVTDKNLTAFVYKLLNITFFPEKIGVYNLILENCSKKLGVCSCVFIVVCWELAVGNFLAGFRLIVF